MGDIFAGSEIVELGIQIEINGRDFYGTLVAKSKDKKAREIFGYLKNEEEKHIAVFQEILDSVKLYEPKEAYPQEYFSYMNSLAREHVFTKENKGRETAERVKTEEEAVDLGMGFEKDSIVFYEGMKRVVPEGEGNIVDKLIEQEKEHLRMLTDLKGGE